jgi:hypothetical protein
MIFLIRSWLARLYHRNIQILLLKKTSTRNIWRLYHLLEKRSSNKNISYLSCSVIKGKDFRKIDPNIRTCKITSSWRQFNYSLESLRKCLRNLGSCVWCCFLRSWFPFAKFDFIYVFLIFPFWWLITFAWRFSACFWHLSLQKFHFLL